MRDVTLPFLLAMLVIGCTHIVTDAPADGFGAVEAAGEVDAASDLGSDLGDDPGSAEESLEIAVEIAPETDSSPACQAACGTGSCPEGQCCENGLCHAQDPDSVTCGWYLPGQQGLDEMCLVNAGAYYVGCDNGTLGCPSEAQPRVKVQLARDVWVDRFEVTNIRYRAYLDDDGNAGIAAPDCDNGSDLWDLSSRTVLESWRNNHPVVCVAAAEAVAYCAWRGKVLPSEADWEAAARGSEGLSFPWPDGFDTHNAQCYRNWNNYDSATQCADAYPANTCEGADDVPNTVCKQKTAPVTLAGDCSLAAGESRVGLCHAAGNAAEWVADGWQGGHANWSCDGESGCVDPFVEPQPGGKRVVRGGSWDSTLDEIRAWARDDVDDTTRSNKIGFRCGWVSQ